jgi:hypothetical protein
MDDFGLKIAGVYSIPCKCGKVYIGQTGRSIETRVNKYLWRIRVNPDKSAVAEQSTDLGRSNQFQDTRILAAKTAYKLSTRKLTLSELNSELQGLEGLQQHKQRLSCGMKPGIAHVKRQLTGSPRNAQN